MEDNYQSPRQVSPIILIIILLQIIFIASIVGIIINNLKNDNKIDHRNQEPTIILDNSSIAQLNLPNDYIADITHSITEATELNTPNLLTSDTIATARADSITLQNFNRHNFNALSFIVDIPSLEQSYQIYYKYPMTPNTDEPFLHNPRAVLCLEDKPQIVYPDFNCQSSQPSDIRQRIATEYLRFFEFDHFTISFAPQASNQIVINPANSVSDVESTSYITELRSAISSLGISPDLFNYQLQDSQNLNYILPLTER